VITAIPITFSNHCNQSLLSISFGLSSARMFRNVAQLTRVLIVRANVHSLPRWTSSPSRISPARQFSSLSRQQSVISCEFISTNGMTCRLATNVPIVERDPAIEKVEAYIAKVELQIEETTDPEEKKQLRKKEEQLRKEKEQLQEEKNLLLRAKLGQLLPGLPAVSVAGERQSLWDAFRTGKVVAKSSTGEIMTRKALQSALFACIRGHASLKKKNASLKKKN